MIFSRRTLCATLCLLVAGLAVGQTATDTQAGATRIVAVGDVHGSYTGLTAILQAADLIDAKHQWIGGKTIFVQTGDIYDRGDGVTPALDLVMSLEGQARRAGGRVEALLGNHEIVSIVGDRRDVSPAMYVSYTNAQSARRRDAAYADLVASAKRRGQEASVPARDVWMTAHPLGYIEYTESVSPRGKYGRWIRSHKAVTVIGKTAFMHAGINHTFQGSIDDVNKTVADDIAKWDAAKDAMVRAGVIPAYATLAETVAAANAELDRINATATATAPKPLDKATSAYVDLLKHAATIEKSSLLADDGPMWFRGFALWKETDEAPFMALIGRLGVDRFIAGHTPMPTRRIMNRWDYRIFQIDTGMLGGDFFKDGRASALELVGDRVTAIYTDSREVVVAGGGGHPALLRR